MMAYDNDCFIIELMIGSKDFSLWAGREKD
jgi:hypothetical protein